ncbi:FAD-dependent oxidoreductase [Stieleria varia]|uniref:FAD-dependent urate hydroxylase n=1 Tax=Stieleria varia TaxID=2528005 RepID=A0A5C6B3B0_9BACT|nr:NAD(P)/FAD-dependent oxidoreductase [Stieleria varia]TWU04984.1 FAD-dependent urate hydroxylase [Stieleria varia]
MNIAVVGSGIAGTAVAWQLADQGHLVTLFEQAGKCGPIGAGILLQPSGQAVLARLGVLDEVALKTAKISNLLAQHRSGRTLVHLPYKKVSGELFGLGVLRSHIFQILFDRCANAGVQIREGQLITSYVATDDGVELIGNDGESKGSFDLLIAADGSRSRLREHSGLTRSIREYPDAALWTIGPYSGPQDRLLQVVGRCGRLMGLLPVGDGRCSFFWGLKKTDEPSVRANGLDAWKRQVVDFFPLAEEAIAEIKSLAEVTYATYLNSRMHRVTQGRVAFIGDAAHATSPHLGQGLNLALVDAAVLAEQMSIHADYRDAYAAYETLRRSTTGYYSVLTGMLTPFFQTSNRVLQFGRDVSLPVMPHLPYVGKQMVYTMAGLKTGWLGVARGA